MNEHVKPAVFLIMQEIKKLETEIDWFKKKNEGHQDLINGNNEKIKELQQYITSLSLDLNLLNSNNESM